jgi:hypothetical protein
VKCEVVRDDMEVSPAFVNVPELQDKIVRREVMRNGKLTSLPFFKAGAELESPDAYWLVRLGCAIPADEACRIRCGMTQEQMDVAQYKYERMQACDVDDYDLYDNKVILRFDRQTQEYVPGPNWHRLEEFRPMGGKVDEEDDDV